VLSEEALANAVMDEMNFVFFQAEYIPKLEISLPILQETEDGQVILTRRVATDKDVKITRSIKIYSLVTALGQNAGYFNKITILIQNISDKDLQDIEVIEILPKIFVETSSQISSDDEFVVLDENPVIKFSLGDVPAGETVEISYTFKSSSESSIIEELFLSLVQPVVFVALTEEDNCMGVICNDFDSCTADGCSDGECAYVPKCGDDVCENGECIIQEKEPAITPVPEQDEVDTDENNIPYLIFLAIVGVIIVVLVFFFFKKTQKSGLDKFG
jgi:hypothetical protein